MFDIRYATEEDLVFWHKLDKHISDSELQLKMVNHRCYILKENAFPIGIMRYNLFWDNLPFLTLIYFMDSYRRRGYGKQAMSHWETEMRSFGFKYSMTSSQADENAQFFYRKLGYKDTGCLILDVPDLSQPTEIFFYQRTIIFTLHKYCFQAKNE